MRWSTLLILMLVSMSLQVVADDKPEPIQRRVEKIPGTTVTFEMVRVPGGTITVKVGENEERQWVVKPFWMGKTEVTWDEYDVYFKGLDLGRVGDPERSRKLDREVFARARPSYPLMDPTRGFGHAGYPAGGIHHNAAIKYCQWLFQLTGKKFRLPNEAEWEWACRSGRTTEPTAPELLKRAWVRENSLPQGGEELQPHPVGKKEPNDYGLHDMLGNVQEWATAIVPSKDTRPVTRGGSYRTPTHQVHFGLRQPWRDVWQERDPEEPRSIWWLSDAAFVGFRVVCDE